MLIKTEFEESMKYANNDVHITHRNDGRYQTRVTLSYEINGEGKRSNYQYKYIYGVNQNDVLIKRAEFIEEQIRIQNDIQITSALLTTKLHSWLYMIKRGQLKPNAFDRLESTYLHQIIPALRECELDGIRLRDVSITHIQRIMDYNLEKGYSISTLKKTRYLLKELFDFYEDDLPKNPMAKYKFYSKDFVIEKQRSLQAAKAIAQEKIALQKSEIAASGTSKIKISEEEIHLAHMKLKSQASQKDIHFFTDDEISRIKDVIENGYRITYTSRSGNEVTSGHYMPKQGKFFLFMLNTGIRGGEAVALKYSDFDFENQTVRIHATAVNTKVRSKDGSATGKRSRTFTSPKSDYSDALLHLSPCAIQIIRDMQTQEPAGYEGFVVHSNFNPIAEKTLWNRWDKLLRGASVNPCGLHSLRHTYGTKLYEVTQDSKLVTQQLRHSDPSFTVKTYIHQSDKRTKEILHDIVI